MLMSADSSQAAAIIAIIRTGVLFIAYWNGRVITKYLHTRPPHARLS